MLAWLVSRDFLTSPKQSRRPAVGQTPREAAAPTSPGRSTHPLDARRPDPALHLLPTALLLLVVLAVARPAAAVAAAAAAAAAVAAAAAAAAAVRAAGELPPAVAVAVAEEPARFAEPLVEVTAAYALQ